MGLPMEDHMKAKGFVGALKRSMYGTQDANNLWQKDHTALLKSHGYAASRANPAVPLCDALDAKLLVRGAPSTTCTSCCTGNLVAHIGSEQRPEAIILNWVVRKVPKDADGRVTMEPEPDQ